MVKGAAKQRKVYENQIEKITSVDIKRMGYRAQILRLGDEMKDLMRNEIQAELTELIRRVILFVLNSKRKTVQPADVQKAVYDWLGLSLTSQVDGKHMKLSEKKKTQKAEGEAGAEPKKAHRFHPGTRAKMNINHLQKTNELIARRDPFEGLIRETLQKADTGVVNIGHDAVLLIQLFVETRIIHLFQAMNLVARHACRETVTKKDLELALMLREHFH